MNLKSSNTQTQEDQKIPYFKIKGIQDIEQRLAAIDVSHYYEVDSTSFHVKKDFETPPVAHPNQLIYTIHKSKTKEASKFAFGMIEKGSVLGVALIEKIL